MRLSSQHLYRLLENLKLRKPLGGDAFEYRNIVFNESINSSHNFNNVFSIDLASKLSIISPDAVYHFDQQPLILFFDFSQMTDHEKESRRESLFKQAWCLDRAPVVFIVGDDSIDIFNAFNYQKSPLFNGLERIDVDREDAEKAFSFWELESGNTWRWLDNQFDQFSSEKTRVNQVLFSNIFFASKQLVEYGLSQEFANLLILRIIFCRYLIDRGVEFDPKYLPGDSIEQRRIKFNTILADRSLLQSLFKYLKSRFNGNLFVIDNDEPLDDVTLGFLSNIFTGSFVKNQSFLFDVFDFSIIPVEMISSIYETIIQPDDKERLSAVYTPTFLADYVLGKTVQNYFLETGKRECKVLDAACGSGIFLVQSYRRMVEQQPEINDQVLTSILVNNIYGIDRDVNALNVAIFSIYVALLDYKNPKTLVDFKLPPMKDKNLFLGDFFDEKASYNKQAVFIEKQFQFIVGNPPWGKKNDKNNDTHHLRYLERRNLPTAKFEISQSFLYRAGEFLNEQAECALIITSKALYNTWAKDFKKYFFENYLIKEFVDLSPVRRILFKDAINPAAIIRFKGAFGTKTDNNRVKHISIKANLFLKYFRIITVEQRDQKWIDQKYLSRYHWIFKALLYGSEQDISFILRLYGMGYNVENLIKDTPDLKYGDGLLSRSTSEKSDSKNKPLLGLPKILTNELTDFYHVPSKVNRITKNDLRIKSGKDIRQYKGTKLLFKARTMSETEILASIVEEDAVYLHCTFGITATKDTKLIHELFGLFRTRLFAYFHFLTSANWGVYIPEIQLKEYLSFPYKPLEKKKSKVLMTSLQKILSNLKKKKGDTSPLYNNVMPAIKVWQGKMDDLINETYELDATEDDLIDYAMAISRYQFQESKYEQTIAPFKTSTYSKLLPYANLFYQQFSQFYNKQGEYFQISIYPLRWFVAMKFALVESPVDSANRIQIVNEKNEDKVMFEILANKIPLQEISKAIFVQKDIKGFEENFFYVIKPNELKCWHRANAHRDIADFMNAIRKASLSKMNYEIA